MHEGKLFVKIDLKIFWKICWKHKKNSENGETNLKKKANYFFLSRDKECADKNSEFLPSLMWAGWVFIATNNQTNTTVKHLFSLKAWASNKKRKRLIFLQSLQFSTPEDKGVFRWREVCVCGGASRWDDSQLQALLMQRTTVARQQTCGHSMFCHPDYSWSLIC